MNLLEKYIKEVHSVKSYNAKRTKEFPKTKFIEVDVTTDCYGCIDRRKEVFQAEEWERFEKARILDVLVQSAIKICTTGKGGYST